MQKRAGFQYITKINISIGFYTFELDANHIVVNLCAWIIILSPLYHLYCTFSILSAYCGTYASTYHDLWYGTICLRMPSS